MDFILRNARLQGAEQTVTDIGVDKGRIVAIAPALAAEGQTIDLGGRLVASGLIETHIHLDKSRILGRCTAQRGDLEEAIGEVARQKQQFTPEDVYQRAKLTIEKAILNGTTHMRTHLEVDPGIGLRGLEGVRPLIEEYKWAIDLQICIFPQEGLLNNPGTDELMVAALKNGAGGPLGQGTAALYLVHPRWLWQEGDRRRGGALYRQQSARPDRSRFRTGAPVRYRHRHASGFRAQPR